jgi:hypothetical protein
MVKSIRPRKSVHGLLKLVKATEVGMQIVLFLVKKKNGKFDYCEN